MRIYQIAITLLNLLKGVSIFLPRSNQTLQVRPFYLLSKHREKKTSTRGTVSDIKYASSEWFYLVDGSHVILMTDFPDSLLLVSAECFLHGKKAAQSTDDK